MQPLKKTLLICTIGSILEWYDFALFGAMAPILATIFFYSSNNTKSLLLTFATFASGFLVRPLGTLFFGQIADRKGRKTALSLTIILMATATTLIGLLPTYTQIGIFAPIFITILRLVQGFSASGEYPTAISLLAETAPSYRRGFYSSFAVCSTASGFVMGTLTVAIISSILSKEAFEAWGWRIPFLMGFPLGLLGLYLRIHMQESAVFEQLFVAKEIKKFPSLLVLKDYPKALIIAIGICILSNVSFYTVFIFLGSYLVSINKFTINTVSFIGALNMMILVILTGCVGWLSDYINRHQILIFGSFGLFLLSYPLFILVIENPMRYFLYAQMIFAIFHAIFIGAIARGIAELFPTHLRVSGISWVLNIASVFGGLAPLVETYLLHEFNNASFSCLYFSSCALIAFVSSIYLKRNYSYKTNLFLK